MNDIPDIDKSFTPFVQGIFLVVADDTEEFPLALRFTTRLAQQNRGRVGVVYVIEPQDFQHWGDVESRMRRELREQAEEIVWDVAKKVNDWTGVTSALFIEEGNKADTVIRLIDEDLSIKRLILSSSTSSSNPGSLVSYFTGKGLARLRVPLVVIPGHLDSETVDSLI